MRKQATMALAWTVLAGSVSSAAYGQTLDSITVEALAPTTSISIGQGISFRANAIFSDGSSRVLSRGTAIAAGGEANQVAVRLISGGVMWWGTNGWGQIGTDTTADSLTPVAVTGIATANAVAAGDFHTCAALDDGTIRCWGRNDAGQLGNGAPNGGATSKAPVAVTGITTAVGVSAGGFYACALLSDGSVRCWGSNGFGQLGDGTTTGANTPAAAVVGISDAVQVAAGRFHACAVRAGGGVSCWGRNDWGQLGDGTLTSKSSPVSVSGITSAVAVAAGIGHSCAVLADGTVKCWGRNSSGELGNGTTTTALTGLPVSVMNISTAGAVTVGLDFSCALLASGAVKCWGANDLGALGNGTTTPSNLPVTVQNLTDATAISAGRLHACALRTDGSAKCWGSNEVGQLGNGTSGLGASSSVPVDVTGLSNALVLAWGSSDPSVATIDAGGTATGLQGGTTTITASAGSVSGSAVLSVLADLTVNRAGSGGGKVTSGDGVIDCGFTCSASYAGGTVTLTATRNSGSVFTGWSGACTGTGTCTVGMTASAAVTATFDLQYYTLSVAKSGSGSVVSSPAAIDCGPGCSASFPIDSVVTLIATPDPWNAFDGWSGFGPGACTGTGTCTVAVDGNKFVNATFTNTFLNSLSVTPAAATIPVGQLQQFVAVGGFSNGSSRALGPGTAIEGGDQFACARLLNGTVQCWGGSYGSSTATTIPGITTAIGLAAGAAHACAVLTGGTVECWGRGQEGQLGDGNFTDSTLPVTVSGISSAVAVTAGMAHSCALLGNGTAKCWGLNGHGQLGDPATVSVFAGTPVAVSGLTGAISVSADGGTHTCAVLTDGTVQCWGNNGDGQLGSGGSPVPAGSLVTVNGIKATAVAAGESHTCALITDGSVQCWGKGTEGQLGNGGLTSSSSPVSVSGINSAVAVAAGDVHSCALLSNGTVQCWGGNGSGQLGSVGGSPGTPVTANGISTAVALAAGDLHTCVILANTSVSCWGSNSVPAGGISSAAGLSWATDSAATAGVDAGGRASGRAGGTASISPSIAGMLTGSATLTVTNTGPNNLNVTPTDSATGGTPATLTFSSVSQAGVTSLTTSSTGPTPPAGFQLGSPAVYYELTTTAVYSGSITVCIDYTGLTFPGGTPQLFHYEGGLWVDRTTSVNPPVVCGSVSSLSPFALFAPADVTLPTIRRISASPNVLGAPNHRMVPVLVAVDVVDDQDPSPSCGIVSVASNEDVNGTGDGDTAPDWNVTAPLALQLRAERSGSGNGRVYTLTVSCADDAGNAVAGTVTVAVPKDQGKKR